MKSGINKPKKRFLDVLSVLVVLAVLISAQQAFGEATIVGSWVSGTSHTKESGTDRALILIAHAEDDGATNLTSVTYGGQAMTRITEQIVGTSYQAYVVAFVLDEDGVAAATSGTFSPTWSVTPDNEGYASVFLENVNQAALIGDYDGNSSASATPNPITTSALTTTDEDMVMLGATCGNAGDYTLQNGFTEAPENDMSSSTGANGYKSASGVPETPSASHNSVNRQVIIGFVVQGTIPDPNIATNPNPSNGEDDVLTSVSLSWDAPTGFTPTSYDVYFGTDSTAHNNPKYTVYTESYDPESELEYETPYYWAVDCNDGGTMHPGNDWNFTTLVRGPVTNPNPGDGESDVSVSTDLSWDAPYGYTPDSYEVYFGTDSTAHNNPKYTVYTESYDPPGDLNEATLYYWAVDCNDGGTIITGSPWDFSTLTPVTVGDRVAGNMILINDNGGWCWYQDEKIAYDPVAGDVLTSTAACYIGFGGVGGGRSNDMDVTTFNLATGKRTRTVAREGYGGDDHNMGAFWIRPDGKYMHFYCTHYTNWETYYRTSTYANDGSSWGSEQSYDWLTIPGSPGSDSLQSSYTNIMYLSDEGTGQGRLYNIIRIFERTPCISYSDDWGANWNYMGRINGITGTTTYSNFYHKFTSNGVDRIDFIGSEQHPRNYNNGVYHGYIQNGKSYNSYGVEIDTINDQTAPTVQAFTPIFIPDANQGPDSYHTGWANEMELDKDGYPVCLYQTRYGTEEWGSGSGQSTLGAADHRFFYARFDGSSWTSTELCKLGGGLHLPEQDYTGMGCIHPDDANIVYVGTPFDPRNDFPLGSYEIFKGVTPDRGLTWDWTQLTFDSTEWNVRPAIPKWDANNTAVVWTRGSWNQDNYEQYDLVVVGMVDQEDVFIGKVTYIDADEINTTEADDTAFTPTGPSGSAGAADNQWHEYTGYGNGGSAYTAGDSGTENAPAVKTTITGLADGTYDVFAYFWCDPEQDWGVRGGFESSDMLCFSKQSSQHAEASQFSGSVTVEDDEAVLYRVYIGRKEISGGAAIDVYIDDYDGSYDSNPPSQTTYDGVGVASVISGCVPGDLNCDGKVNFVDFAILGQGWLDTYDYDTLGELADNWLYVT